MNYKHNSNGAAIDWTKFNDGDEFKKFTAESSTVTLHGLYMKNGTILILEEIIHDDNINKTVGIFSDRNLKG